MREATLWAAATPCGVAISRAEATPCAPANPCVAAMSHVAAAACAVASSWVAAALAVRPLHGLRPPHALRPHRWAAATGFVAATSAGSPDTSVPTAPFKVHPPTPQAFHGGIRPRQAQLVTRGGEPVGAEVAHVPQCELERLPALIGVVPEVVGGVGGRMGDGAAMADRAAEAPRGDNSLQQHRPVGRLHASAPDPWLCCQVAVAVAHCKRLGEPPRDEGSSVSEGSAPGAPPRPARASSTAVPSKLFEAFSKHMTITIASTSQCRGQEFDDQAFSSAHGASSLRRQGAERRPRPWAMPQRPAMQLAAVRHFRDRYYYMVLTGYYHNGEHVLVWDERRRNMGAGRRETSLGG